MTEIKKEDSITIIPKGVKITGYKVLDHGNKKITHPDNEKEQSHELEYVHEGLERGRKLIGVTYKLKPPQEESAIYLTINDILLNEGTKHEQLYPYEVFINSKKMESWEWIACVTRLISAIFRKGGNITFIVDELKEIFAPKGGYFGKDVEKPKGKYYNSILNEIGYLIELHMKEIGLIEGYSNSTVKVEDKNNLVKEHEEPEKVIKEDKTEPLKEEPVSDDDYYGKLPGAFKDSPCLEKNCGCEWYTLKDGCPACLDCGHSKCG